MLTFSVIPKNIGSICSRTCSRTCSCSRTRTEHEQTFVAFLEQEQNENKKYLEHREREQNKNEKNMRVLSSLYVIEKKHSCYVMDITTKLLRN